MNHTERHTQRTARILAVAALGAGALLGGVSAAPASAAAAAPLDAQKLTGLTNLPATHGHGDGHHCSSLIGLLGPANACGNS